MRKADDDDDGGGSLSPLLAAASQFCYTMLQCEERHFRHGRSNSITPVAPFSSCSYFLMFPFSNVPKLSCSLFLIFLFAHVPIFSCSHFLVFPFSNVPIFSCSLFILSPIFLCIEQDNKNSQLQTKGPWSKSQREKGIGSWYSCLFIIRAILLEIESSA